MIEILYKIFIENDSKIGRLFDVFIKVLIIISLLSFSIETLPGPPGKREITRAIKK